MTARQISQRLDLYLKVSRGILLVLGASAIILNKFNIDVYVASCQRLPIGFEYANCWLSGAKALFERFRFQLVLGAFTFAWYVLYEWAVTEEKKFIEDVFASPKLGSQPKRLKDEVTVIFLAVAVPLVFILLFYSVDRIQLYSFVVLALSVLDLTGNVILRENMQRFVSDADAIKLSDSDKNYIRAKRKVAEWYWIELPQFRRLVLHMLVNTLALFIATKQLASVDIEISANWSYLIICAGILGNESVLFLWRRRRRVKLQRIAHLEYGAIRVDKN